MNRQEEDRRRIQNNTKEAAKKIEAALYNYLSAHPGDAITLEGLVLEWRGSQANDADLQAVIRLMPQVLKSIRTSAPPGDLTVIPVTDRFFNEGLGPAFLPVDLDTAKTYVAGIGYAKKTAGVYTSRTDGCPDFLVQAWTNQQVRILEGEGEATKTSIESADRNGALTGGQMRSISDGYGAASGKISTNAEQLSLLAYNKGPDLPLVQEPQPQLEA